MNMSKWLSWLAQILLYSRQIFVFFIFYIDFKINLIYNISNWVNIWVKSLYYNNKVDF